MTAVAARPSLHADLVVRVVVGVAVGVGVAALTMPWLPSVESWLAAHLAAIPPGA